MSPNNLIDAGQHPSADVLTKAVVWPSIHPSHGIGTSEAVDDALPVRLAGLATAVPPHELKQGDIAREATALFSGRYADFDRLRPVFESTGIERRYAVRPFEWFREPHGWPDRTETYLQCGTDLFVKAATAALHNAGLRARDVDTVITVSSTGIATPSLEARALVDMGFREDIARIPVFGLGCAGGVSGLALAARLARAQPGSVVLMVAVELCTLAFRTDTLTKANIVATAVFADGAAAAVVSTAPANGTGNSGTLLGASGQTTWPGTLDIMGWDVDPVGFGAIFSKNIPALVRER
ncbi:MAG: type III polyketide synthase, partial [Hyphomicrobiaceae bacterium]